MAHLFSGEINTNYNWEKLSEFTNFNLVSGQTYKIQVLNSANLRKGTTGEGFYYINTPPFDFVAGDEDVYIKTSGLSCLFSIEGGSTTPVPTPEPTPEPTQEPTPTQYTLTISPTPADATVVLTATGFTQVGNSITVDDGTSVSYTVSASGYQTATGTYTLNGANHTENVVLETDQPLQTVPMAFPDDIVDMTIYYQPYQGYESSLFWDTDCSQPVRATSPDDSIMNVYYHIATTNPSIINLNGNQYYSLLTSYNPRLLVTNTAGDILYVQGTITDGEDFGELSYANEIYTYDETNNTMVTFMQFYAGQTGMM